LTRHHLQLVTEAPARPVRPRALRTVRPRPARPRVERTRLVACLTAEDAPPLVVLVAPAGYGKTMLLEQWAEADVRAFAWATLDERDNDPGHLLASVNDAVGRVPMSRPDDGFVVVLDDVHVLRRTAARDTLGAIAG
jgi:ATP/maltotriose-dependent transcriptional regulator MalT